MAPMYGDIEAVFDLIASELPEDMFATDRADDPDYTRRSVSSSEIRASSSLIQGLYDSLIRIYNDKFLTTVTEDGVPRWEKMLFAEAQDSGQTYQVRVSNLLAKLRATGGISFTVIHDILSGLFEGTGLAWDLVTLRSSDNAWVLDESLLDVGTYLNGIDPLEYASYTCDNPSAWPPGILEQVQRIAYTYQVRIRGHANDALIARINKVLTDFEPARSTHEILNDFSGAIAP